MGSNTNNEVQAELDLARDALRDAGVLFEGGGTEAGVINRLYYAAFHAAQAVLYARDVYPSSHGGVRQKFGQHVVLPGDATPSDGRLLGTPYDYRQEADYGNGVSGVDVARLLERVDAFVARMDSLSRQDG